MIEILSHPEIEIRVLRIVLSRPQLIAVVPDLEVQDFWNPWHRMLWTAIRSVAEVGIPDDHDEMLARCADWIGTRPGAEPDNPYGIVADELTGMSTHRMFNATHRPVIDPMIMKRDSITPDHALRAELSTAQATLRFSRRARDQMAEQNPRRR